MGDPVILRVLFHDSARAKDDTVSVGVFGRNRQDAGARRESR